MILMLYGAGGLARELYDVVIRSTPQKYEKIIFIDDFTEEGSFYDNEVIHFDTIKQRFGERIDTLEGLVAVGEPSARELLTGRFELGIKLATVIDSTSIISTGAVIGAGTVICEFSTIHCNVNIGKSVLIQPYCDVGHDIIIGDYSVMSSNCTPGGQSVFGKRVYMGMNAASKEKLVIGDDVIIAMGAVVFKDIEPGATVVGNPARITKGNNEHKVF